jgi:hypothetical protein
MSAGQRPDVGTAAAAAWSKSRAAFIEEEALWHLEAMVVISIIHHAK